MSLKYWAAKYGAAMLPYFLFILCSCGGPPGCPGGVFVANGCAASSSSGGGNGGGNLGGGGGGGNGGGGNGSGSLSPPTTVTVGANQTATADITVSAPVSTTPPNIVAVGVDSNGFAYATGGAATQGEPNGVVTLFGPGITSNMQVSFSGPNDITVSNVQSVIATDGTPGLQFNIAVAGNALLGSRTLILQSSNNDVTTFTGGVEIIP